MSRPVLTDLDFNNAARVRNLPAPLLAGDAATKDYVDSAVEGLAWKDSVRVATAANINLASPGASVDGIAMALNDRVLVRAQTTASQNGIYLWNGAAVAMTRAPDANTFAELEQAIVPVEEGSSAGAAFRQTAVNGTLETTAIAWSGFATAAPSATTSTAGLVELATQAEVDAGTDASRALTPQMLANWSGRLRKFAQVIGDGSATQFTVTHNFNTQDAQVSVRRTSGAFDEVICDVEYTTVNSITVRFASAPASGGFRVVVFG